MNDEQQDWFGQFTPARGVHLAPPPASPGPRQEIVFRRSARARSYRLSLGRDGVAVATIPFTKGYLGATFSSSAPGWALA